MRLWLYVAGLFAPLLFYFRLPEAFTELTFVRWPIESILSTASEEVRERVNSATKLFNNAINEADTSDGERVPIAAIRPQKRSHTTRHGEELVKLNKRLSKGHGQWNMHHPRRRLLDALYGFAKYHEQQSVELDRLKGLYKHVSKKQKKLLEHRVHYSTKFARIDQLLAENQNLCERIVKSSLQYYSIDVSELNLHIQDLESQDRKADKVSVSQALKHIVRDWTKSGEHERVSTFTCIRNSLNHLFPDLDGFEISRKVLLPGAGLGRLGHELAEIDGFEITINEWSMYMNVVYRFIETLDKQHTEALHPFVDSWSHHATAADMERKLPFPDAGVNASSVLLVEGDFTTVFSDSAGVYDVVITYFFIDTARNLLSYFDTIKHVLKPGGYWLNLGPLLYGTGPFVQLSVEEIILVVEGMGFRFLDADGSCGDLTLPGRLVRGQEAIYGFDDRALTKNAYSAQCWIAQRPMP